MRNPNITDAEQTAAEEEVADAVKAALLISGADKRRYGRLKEQLANNYLLGTDQYPDTLEKASMILGNYQVAKGSPFGDRRNTNKGGGACIHTAGSPRGTRPRRTGRSDHKKRRRRYHRGRRRCSKRECIYAIIRGCADKQHGRQPLLPLRGRGPLGKQVSRTGGRTTSSAPHDGGGDKQRK